MKKLMIENSNSLLRMMALCCNPPTLLIIYAIKSFHCVSFPERCAREGKNPKSMIAVIY